MPQGYAVARQHREPLGRLESGALSVAGQRIPIVPEAVLGYVDASVDFGRFGALIGWALDSRRGLPADEVAVFVGGRLQALVKPSLARPDVAAAMSTPHAVVSGYRAILLPGRGRSIRVFGIADGRASELTYGTGDLWPHR